MTQPEVLLLRSGDEVLWHDPDDSICTHHLIIQTIEVKGSMVVIQDTDGDVLECFASELS